MRVRVEARGMGHRIMSMDEFRHWHRSATCAYTAFALGSAADTPTGKDAAATLEDAPTASEPPLSVCEHPAGSALPPVRPFPLTGPAGCSTPEDAA